MSEIALTSEITVRLIQQVGGDLSIVRAARVSTVGAQAEADPENESPTVQARLIGYLVKHRHGSPFEHSQATMFVHAPAFVWWEWIRHRIGQTVDCETEVGFNLESGRYKVLDPVFWIPRADRKMFPAPDHKAARPKFIAVPKCDHDFIVEEMRTAYGESWHRYQRMVASGIANEVARSVLGFGVYYSGWVTANPRSLMSFLSLRTHEPAATFPSYPQAEIEEAARAAEAILAEYWPITHAAFVANGRVGP